MLQVVDPVGNGSTDRITREIIDIDHLGLASPGPTRVFEITNQFFFLGIDADDGMTGGPKQLLDPPNVPELTISIWMRRTAKCFTIGSQ